MMNQPILELLSSYPRQRPSLTEKHKEIYVQEYQSNRAPNSALGKAVAALESWMHKKVAGFDGELLEVGAGTLNHLPYEDHPKAYDVVEPFHELYRTSPNISLVRNFYDDITEVPLEQLYDRIISVAVLEHLTNLPAVIAKSGLLLRPGGSFEAGIPTEGGLLWGLGWRLTTGIAYRIRTGLDYGQLMRYEHINNAVEIIDVVKYFFEDVRIELFPLPMFHLSFYTHIHASKPRMKLCCNLLNSTEKR